MEILMSQCTNETTQKTMDATLTSATSSQAENGNLMSQCTNETTQTTMDTMLTTTF